jgi:type II secretory pathway component GspD/PulD (secretin)
MSPALPLASLALFALAAPQDPAPPQDTAQVEVVALEYTAAEKVAAVLRSKIKDARFTPDARTNSLLISSTAAALPGIKDIIARIDVKLVERPEDPLFPAPSADLVVPAGDGNQWSLMALVDEYGRLTDQHFVISPETRNLLESTQTGLTRSVVVPESEVQSFFESLLVQMNFVITVHRSAAPRLLSIESLNTGARTTLRAKAIYVEDTALDRFAGHPSLLVTTVVTLPNSDVRQLSNSMRTMITDANTQQMLPAGNSNAMVLTGFAPAVADLVQLLKITDEASQVEVLQPSFARFVLVNAVAGEVAEAVEELVHASYRRMDNRQPQQAQGVATYKHGHADVRVIADPRTNALLVMAMPYDLEKVEQLVGLLDQ